MPTIVAFADANLAIIQAYPAMRAALPEADQAELDRIVSVTVPPEKVSMFFELAYARREALDGPTKAVAADVGNFAWRHGFWGLGQDQRGQRMEAALRGQEVDEAPAVLAQYSPPVPVVTAPPAAG